MEKDRRIGLIEYISQIKQVDLVAAKTMEKYIDGLTKPVGALGSLEELVIQLSGIYGRTSLSIRPHATVIMCADNGVCDEGVSSCPQEVTATVTTNFTKGITAMNQLSRFSNSHLHIIDIGVIGNIDTPGVVNRKIMQGTKNMTKEPAMTYEEALEAIWIGIEETEKLIDEGYQMFGTGEMGIGNTTTSAAVLAALVGLPTEDVTGRGAGAKETVYASKINSVSSAITINKPNPNDPVDVLAKVGGLDLAGLVGVYLAAAKNRKAVVIDGFIAGVAAVVCSKLAPVTTSYMIASHLSEEPGMKSVLNLLEKKAYLNLGMRLGEGSGCPIMFQILDMAIYTLLGMGTFEDAGVERSNYEDIWKTPIN